MQIHYNLQTEILTTISDNNNNNFIWNLIILSSERFDDPKKRRLIKTMNRKNCTEQLPTLLL